MSKHSQSGSGKSHPQPNQHSAAHDKCDVSGSIEVRGVIETKLPPNLAQERNTAEQKKETRDKRRFVVEVIGAILVFIYATIAAYQACLIWKSNKINHSSTVVNNRAWLQPSFSWPDPKQDGFPDLANIKELNFPMKVVNVGNTPTGQVTIDTIIEIADSNNEPSLDYSATHKEIFGGSIFPKQSWPFPAILYRPDGSEGFISPSEVEQLQLGKSYIVVFGKISYTDSFGTHWTHFCAWRGYAIGKTFMADNCANYNQVDIQDYK